MTTYAYTAQNASGKVLSGTLNAESHEAAIQELQSQKLRPLVIEETRASSSSNLNLNLKLFKRNRVKGQELVLFTRQLSTMISAGVPLMRALTTLSKQIKSEYFSGVITQVSNDVGAGTALGNAFAKHPKVFNDVYVNMVRAGESGGILDEILQRLAVQQEKNDSMRKKIKSAMTYPMVLVGITVIAFFGLMIFVIPRIGDIIKDLGGADAELPGITRFMLGISDFTLHYWYIMIAVIIGLIILLNRYLATKAGKRLIHGLVLRIPVIKNVIVKVVIARFSRTFASLNAAGVGVLEALHVTGAALGNVIFQEMLEKAAEDVKNGKQLSASLSAQPLFPLIVPQMLAVGEETGMTDKVLVKVADFYEEEVDTMIASLSSIIEPIMIAIIGAAVGLIAASVMIPIASLSQNIQA